jgi:hypothetical protein
MMLGDSATWGSTRPTIGMMTWSCSFRSVSRTTDAKRFDPESGGTVSMSSSYFWPFSISRSWALRQ